jgi:hypothetical protein
VVNSDPKTQSETKKKKNTSTDILYTLRIAVRNKYAPLANIQKSDKENFARHQKKSEELVTNLSHRNVLQTTSMNPQKQPSYLPRKGKQHLDCKTDEQKPNQSIPTIINGNLIYNTKNRTGPYKKMPTKNREMHEDNLKLDDITSKTNGVNGRTSEHKITTTGDRFLRGCAENVKTYLSDRYEVFCVVKPSAKVNTLTNSLINDISQLTFKDLIILCGGTNDIGRNCSSSIVKQMIDFIRMDNHTNILISSIPYRHDLASHSQLNKESKATNKKLLRISQAYDHTEMLIIDDNRKLYTRHGLHLNKVGKSVLTSEIARFICAILKQKTSLPIAMNWKLESEYSVSIGNLLTGDSQNNQLLFSSHEIPLNRKSNRVKKLLVTRTKDFVW